VITPEELKPAPEGTVYPFQLIGFDVYSDDGSFLGKLSEYYTQAGMGFYEIKSGRKEILVPANKEFTREISMNDRKLILHLPEGMIES